VSISLLLECDGFGATEIGWNAGQESPGDETRRNRRGTGLPPVSCTMNNRHISGAFPLSPMQQGMLFHHLQEPHSGVDIEQLVVHLSEIVDVPRLRQAWQWLVNRHGILRAQFVWEGVEQPRQRIIASVSVPFTLEDRRGRGDTLPDAQLNEFLGADRDQGFDLGQAPLLRITLFQWSEASFSMVWTFHHALLDGRSYPTLLREVFEAYRELEMGAIAERPAPPPYRSYIEWLQQQDFTAAESFWKESLKGFSAPTPLVVDFRRTGVSPLHRQGELWRHVDSGTTRRLKEFAETHDLTLNSIVMGAWAILLHRYSGEKDIVFGATRACRKSSVAGADETVGIFINTVPVRVKLCDSDSVLSVCQDLRRTWVGIRPFEHTPLAQVRRLSQVPPGRPLFETLLVFENYRLDQVMQSLGGSWSDRRVDLHELTNFPITLAAYNGEELSCKIEFDQQRLSEESIRRLLNHLTRLLEGLATNPFATVGDLPLISEAEHRELTEQFGTTADLSVMSVMGGDSFTLHERFEAQAARRPDGIALVCDGQTLTYAELNAQANRLARELVKCGVQPDTLVGLCLDRSNELVTAILGILKAGGAYLPIDLSYPADRVAFMLEDAQAPVLLTHSRLKDQFPSTPARVVCVDEILAGPAQAGDEANLPPAARSDHLAYVIYTSGTTGKPKGSLITHHNVTRLFTSTEHWYRFSENDTWTLFHSSAFDFSVWEIWGALLYGGRVVVVPFLVSRSPEMFYELVANERVTMLSQTPSAFRQFIQAEESVGQRQLALRHVVFGGEAIEMQSLRPWFERHGDQTPRLVNMYGITETTVHVTYRPLSKDDLDSGSVIGVPIPDLQIYILDAHLRPVPIGVPGEMYVGGAGLARGYLRRPELTEQRFIPDSVTGKAGARLYRTGDLARVLPGRDIEYLGRIDQQVKIRGFRIELGEIESVLCQHASIREAAVIARADGPGDKRLVAYAVAAGPAPPISALREHLKKKMPEYMVPAAFVFLDRLPLTGNGKLDRDALPAPEQQRPELAARYLAPRTPAEEKLAAIWSKVLRVDRVGISDNFFELGGDSILTIQIVSLARREGLKVTPSLLFAHPTIAELAAAAGVADEAPAGPENLYGDVPLTPIQHWFFEQNLAEPHHYNQAYLFEVAEPLDKQLLESAMRQVVRHHDALRLRFVRGPHRWRQFYAGSEDSALVNWKNISAMSDAEQRHIIETVSLAAQSTLDLEHGPLCRVVYFDRGASRPGRLFIAVHHLAVDGISWRPLLEDLESAYSQAKAGKVVQLPPKTSSSKLWAERLRDFSQTESLQNTASFWKEVQEPDGGAAAAMPSPSASAANTEGSAGIVTASLTVEETQALLQTVPGIYNTQINDALLTALARAWFRWTGSHVLLTNLEGHGRENLFEGVDLSRTVGWFTSIYPVRLEMPPAGSEWRPGEALKSIKEQLRRVPQRGVGYGVLRYLSPVSNLSAQAEPGVVFNYMGQFDQVLEGSRLFRFASEPSGAWHSPLQVRRHPLEANGRVIGGRFELALTYSRSIHTKETVERLVAEFTTALREILAHCQSAEVGGRTPSDFPLVRLNQQAVDRLVGQGSAIEDICPLSPMQTLFFAAGPGEVLTEFDHWHCTLRGDLDLPAFQQAWHETVRRHSVLRSTVVAQGLPEPVQLVHRDVELPWSVHDWRALPSSQHAERWSAFLKEDRGQPLSLTQAPAMRFALVRLAENTWKFLWSVPALLLDGWSWPLVFRDASRLYEAVANRRPLQLENVRPYRYYLEWLAKQSTSQAKEFWRENMMGFREPTPLPVEPLSSSPAGERYARHALQFSSQTTAALEAEARSLQITPGALVAGAWALLLNRQTGNEDVVLGAAFSGRPAELPGAESIVGPFVNNLPVRTTVQGRSAVGDFFRRFHGQLLALNPFQFTPLMDIQRVSEVPWRHRLFDSLVVFQNYAVDESARRFGDSVRIEDFVGPVHNNCAMLLLAEPGPGLRLTLIYDRQRLPEATVANWGRDLRTMLERAPDLRETSIAELQELLSPPASVVRTKRTFNGQSQNFVPPQTEMEHTIAGVWQTMFGAERIGIEENFFDLGGHSLLLVQTHSRLRDALKVEFPIVTMFEHPTIRSLARHLNEPVSVAPAQAGQWRDRAQRQKQALAQMRGVLKQ
jgi:amino acid adenylation domain-containing protein/non-ribosomal peptide synthase protein (TIGR01720 family)